MKIPKLPDNVKVHSSVWRNIREIRINDEVLAAKIVQRISKLGFDPKPFNEECNSVVIQNLKRKYNINVRRLRCIDIGDYRVFYAVRKSSLICVYAVVFAGKDMHDYAYQEDSHHYTLIKLLYYQWRDCQ